MSLSTSSSIASLIWRLTGIHESSLVLHELWGHHLLHLRGEGLLHHGVGLLTSRSRGLIWCLPLELLLHHLLVHGQLLLLHHECILHHLHILLLCHLLPFSISWVRTWHGRELRHLIWHALHWWHHSWHGHLHHLGRGLTSGLIRL